MGSSLEFRLLGEVEAIRDGEPLRVGGRRQLALLALLLIEPGRPISADRLADELWQGRPPSGSPTTLRSYVSRLRSVLGPDAPVSGGPAGYSLEVAPDQVDSHRFERLASDGASALARRRVQRAGVLLRTGLELWRGRALAELTDIEGLRLEAERLEDLRQRAVEGRIEADLALGSGAELVEELEALTRDHPYRERLWGHLMLALYRAERQADALAAYRRAREVLDEQLGIEPSEALRKLEQAILRHEVPRPVAPEQRHNLPAPVTSFIGREAELDDIAGLLEEHRLVTLTGVGGVGKTRLALEAANRSRPDFPDGVFFVDFASLADGALVPRHVAQVVSVDEEPHMRAEETLAGLGESELLLVFDNCEHLREACQQLVSMLLVACPTLRVLATSRELLGAPGEVDYAVLPLAEAEAVRLLLVRSRESRPQLRESDATLESAARIAQDLDGIPLAIELAAARAKVLSLEEIAARLSDRFRFLVSWRRLSAARHSTLREAMDWSYELLSVEERDLLEKLAVFAGGFTLQAVAAVCVDGDEERALELVSRLVDASLVVPEQREAGTRYRLLETVRQYAAERLAESMEELRRRHAEWCMSLAERAEGEITGAEQTRWFELLDAEADNFRSALATLREAGDSDRLLALAISLSRFWYVRGHLEEARGWLERALEDARGASLDVRRRGLTAAAAVTLLQGDYAASASYAERALAASRESGEPVYVANSLSNLGAIVLAMGDTERARALLEEAVALAREVGDARILALAVNNLGDVALTVGDYQRAEPLFEESLGLLRARGDTANVARSLFNLGAVALQSDRMDDARAHLQESLELAEEAGDKEDLAWCLEGAAALAAARGEGESAAQMLGAATGLLATIGGSLKPFERQLHEATEARARELCGTDLLAVRLAEGEAIDLTAAIATARSELAER